MRQCHLDNNVFTSKVSFTIVLSKQQQSRSIQTEDDCDNQRRTKNILFVSANRKTAIFSLLNKGQISNKPSNVLRVISDTWYSHHIRPQIADFEKSFLPGYPSFFRTLAARIPLVKSLLFYRSSRSFDRVLISIANPGVYYFILFEWLFSKRRARLLVLEFIRAVPYSPIMKIIYPAWCRLFLEPALRKTLCKAQVLTTFEVNAYAEKFNIPIDKIHYVPWPLHYDVERIAEPIQSNEANSLLVNGAPFVMVSGLNNVDWNTVIKAARNGGWTLLAVCSKKHRGLIEDLAEGDPKIIIVNNISQYEHAQYLKRAKVFVISLLEYHVSVGQIRFMNSIENGVPVVVSDVIGLRDYAVDRVNALIVPPYNTIELQTAVDKLLSDGDLRNDLITSAKKFMPEQSFSRYISEIAEFTFN